MSAEAVKEVTLNGKPTTNWKVVAIGGVTVIVIVIAGGALSPKEKFHDSFDNGQADARWTTYVRSESYAPHGQAPFVSNPTKAGAGAANYYVHKGDNEVTPINFYAGPDQLVALLGDAKDMTTELRVEWHENFAADYPFPSSSQKLLRIGFDDPTVPDEKKEYGVLIQNNGKDLNLQYFCGGWGEHYNLCRIDQAVHSNQPMPRGQWVKLALHLKLNTPGKADGFLKLYKDDSLFLDTKDADLRGNCVKGVNYLWLGGNYSMLAGGTALASGSRYIDEIRFYNK